MTVAFCGIRGTEYNSAGVSPFKGGRHEQIPLPKFGLRPNNRKGRQPHPSTENWIKDLLSMALPISTRSSFPLSQVIPSGSFHKPLILLHQRASEAKSLSRVRLLVTPWTATYQAPPSMGFSRQEYWSGLPFHRLKTTITEN